MNVGKNYPHVLKKPSKSLPALTTVDMKIAKKKRS